MLSMAIARPQSEARAKTVIKTNVLVKIETWWICKGRRETHKKKIWFT